MKATYHIIDTSRQDLGDILEVCVQTVDSMRRSLDGTQGVVWYHGATPQILENEVAYDHTEVSAELQKPEWTAPGEI